MEKKFLALPKVARNARFQTVFIRLALIVAEHSFILRESGMTAQRKSGVVTSDTPLAQRRVDRMVQALTGSSRRQTQGLFDVDCVHCNGQVCHEPWRHLEVGDEVAVEFDPGQRYAPRKRSPSYLGFEVLAEDEHLIVVNKPAGWLTVPSPKRERNTLIQRVAEYLTRRQRGRQARVWAVHRLDRGVSGVLVFARTPDVVAALRQTFAEHKPERTYVAIVAGVVDSDSGEFRSQLAPGKGLRMRSLADGELGQLAITRYQVLRRTSDATLVRVQLETGRRNQIRVHFSEAGHPILGDTMYAPEAACHDRWPFPRLALHAEHLAFVHPATGQTCEYQVPWPEEFEAFLG